MIDKTRLQLILEDYKKDFTSRFNSKNSNEKFKWIAVKHFQDNWDIDAQDFLQMFEKATAKTENLLVATNYFPKGMLINFIKAAPEDVRTMFRNLYDENKSVVTRVEDFIKESERIRAEYEPQSGWKSHYQNANSITTYLWLRYPDKYYIYKYSECREVAREISKTFRTNKGAKPETLLGAIKLYDEIAEYISADIDLVNMVKNSLDETCYPDPEFRTLAIDVGFYISRYHNQERHNTIEYAWYVGASINEIDCSETFISEGRWENGYKDKYIDEVNSMKAGDKIAIKVTYTRKNVPFHTNGNNVSVMGIKAIGTIAENHQDGHNVSVKWEKVFEPKKEWFFFTLRKTLWYVNRSNDDWMYGALLDFTFGNVKQDYDKFLKVPYWQEKYIDDISDAAELPENKTEEIYDYSGLPIRKPRKSHLHSLNTILYGAPGTGKTYLTAEYAMAVLENRPVNTSKFTVDERIALINEYKKNIKNGRIVFTTFHQSYGYEDFIQGIRPDADSGSLKFIKSDGVFKRIAEKAMHDSLNNYVIIIDEINRANISKVFGELITLIEEDKRWGELNELSVTLPMGDTFAIPNNLYIVGTMNSADKSISLIDTALRRRFDFVEVPSRPEFVENTVLRKVLSALNEKLVEELDSSDLLIGHAYFMGKTEADLPAVFNKNIIPLLYEYFYDNEKKVKTVVEKAVEGLDYKVISAKTSRLRIEKKD